MGHHLHRNHMGMAAFPPKSPVGNTAIKTASNLNFQLFQIKTTEEGTGCTPCLCLWQPRYVGFF